MSTIHLISSEFGQPLLNYPPQKKKRLQNTGHRNLTKNEQAVYVKEDVSEKELTMLDFARS